MSRFTPLSTRICIGLGTLCDQPFELTADICSRPRLDAGTGIAEEDEVDLVAGSLLVAQQRLPGALRVDPNRLRCELALDVGGVPARHPQGREQAERDGLPMRQVVVCGGLETVGERVPQVEPPARP